MRQDEWAQGVVAVIGASIAHYRTSRQPKMSAQKLADACSALGYPRLTRSVITNLETGAKESISVPEWLVLAAALQVAPLLLLYPVGRVEHVEPLPDVSSTPMDAVQWAETGQLVAEVPEWGRRSVVKPHAQSDAQVIRDFREHQDLLSHWQGLAGRREAAQRFAGDDEKRDRLREIDADRRTTGVALRRVRDNLRSRGLTPPELPTSHGAADLAYALGEDPAAQDVP